nr:signal recognition particle receptor subunit alpha [Candidatus Sigynarchaeota archaeon]
MVLDGLRKSIDNAVRALKRLPRIDQEALEQFIGELRKALIEGDVNVDLAIALTNQIKKQAFDQQIAETVTRQDFIVKLLHDQLTRFLGDTPAPIRIQKGKENIVLLVGIQGSGKTTTVGKLANYYKKHNFKVGLVCTDTWRPGAYEQLKQLGEKVEVPVYGNPAEKDSIKLAVDGVKYFFDQKEKPDLVIVDTAGRHKEEKTLIKEMHEIETSIKPDETVLVIDATLGQQAYSQALAFAQNTAVGSIIVTKLDGTAKGGGALSACAATGAKIKFIGTGEHIDDLELFNPQGFVGSLLNIPDLESLLETFEEANFAIDPGAEKRYMSGKLTLDDMLVQLRQFKKMSMSKIFGALGIGGQLPPEFSDIAKDQIKKWEIVLQSMTTYEKENPVEIKGSRITRIAIGSGAGRSEIKKLLAQFDTMNKFMKRVGKNKKMLSSIAKGGLPALGGMGGKGMKGFPGGFPGMPGQKVKKLKL